jgi:oligopeptide/dipeptide ABC transporter ATP-binding protein
MILVTHDLGVVAGRADEIAVMYAGQIVERAPTRALFADVKMPYTEALLRSIPRIEEPSHRRLAAIGGRPPVLVDPPVGCRFAPRCPYAQDKCREEAPPLREAATAGHVYRCWFPVAAPAAVRATAGIRWPAPAPPTSGTTPSCRSRTSWFASRPAAAASCTPCPASAST